MKKMSIEREEATEKMKEEERISVLPQNNRHHIKRKKKTQRAESDALSGLFWSPGHMFDSTAAEPRPVLSVEARSCFMVIVPLRTAAV